MIGPPAQPVGMAGPSPDAPQPAPYTTELRGSGGTGSPSEPMAHTAMVMIRLPKSIESVTPSGREEQRRASRMRCDAKCSLGRVLDLSLTGIQVLRKSAPSRGSFKMPEVIWIEAPDGEHISVKVQLKRHQKTGFRKHETGYTFVELTDEQKRVLGEIARCSVRHEIGWGRSDSAR